MVGWRLRSFDLARLTRAGITFAVFVPQITSNFERVDIPLLPPLPFLAGRMDLVVMDSAKRDGEFIADLQTQPFGLRVADVVRL